MTMRATATVTITFGLVAIPVKLYVSASEEGPTFNMLTPAGNKVRQKWVDSVTGEEAPYDTLDKGYEFAKGQFVKFTKDELATLEMVTTKTIDIVEFVDAESIDFVHVEKTYYCGPDKGADKGYQLLSDAMRTQDKVAVAQWTNRGKQHLVVVRPYKLGLVIQILWYAEEVRDFSQITVAPIKISDAEQAMAAKLIQTLTNKDGFDPNQYEDKYAKSLREAVDQKIAGKEITIAQDAPTVTTMDLFAALKQSLEVKPKAKVKKAPKKAK